MRAHGFTLLEILIVASLLAVVSLLGLTALQSSGTSVNLTRAQSLAQMDARAVLSELTHELEMAVKRTRDDVPGVEGIRIEAPRAAEDAEQDVESAIVTELVFQRPGPEGSDGWSQPITYRFVNEDTNRNGVLDPNESDLDVNDRATSVVERLEDRNLDGDNDDAGERRIVGSAQSITDLTFAFDGNVLTVAVEATCAVPGTVVDEGGGELTTRVVRSALSGVIYPLN